MEKYAKEEVKLIWEGLIYSEYNSFHEFLEQLRGFEKMSEHRFKMGKFTKPRELVTESDKALLYDYFTIVCDHNLLTGCRAYIEMERNRDILNVTRFKREHNHSPVAEEKNTLYFQMKEPHSSYTIENFSQQISDGLGEDHNSSKLFSYPYVQRTLVYVRCSWRCCKAHHLGLENPKGFYLLRSNNQHNHEVVVEDEESDAEMKPIDAKYLLKDCFQRALNIVARGLTATSEQETNKAMDDIKSLFLKCTKKI